MNKDLAQINTHQYLSTIHVDTPVQVIAPNSLTIHVYSLVIPMSCLSPIAGIFHFILHNSFMDTTINAQAFNQANTILIKTYFLLSESISSATVAVSTVPIHK